MLGRSGLGSGVGHYNVLLGSGEIRQYVLILIIRPAILLVGIPANINVVAHLFLAPVHILAHKSMEVVHYSENNTVF